jgi:putative ABC transport system substrate-binding protein
MDTGGARGGAMNERRKLICGLALAAGLPVAFRARSEIKPFRLGFFYSGSEKSALDTGRYASFLRGMRELGYVEGKDYVIEARYTDGVHQRAPALARELLDSGVHVIVAHGMGTIVAVQQATARIPVVMTISLDPVRDGVVPNLARPGGNVTGLTSMASEVGEKHVELMKALLPRIATIGVLWKSDNPGHPAQLGLMQAAATRFSIDVVPKDALSSPQIARALAELSARRVDALVIIGETFFVQQARQLADLSLKHRLPAVYFTQEFPEAGGLMSYGPDIADNFRRAASYVHRIVRGARPGDLPIEQPTKFELVINLKTAQALGISIPQTMLLRADRLIE